MGLRKGTPNPTPQEREVRATPLELSANGTEVRRPAGSRPHRRSFWAVAFVFFTVMGFSTVPSPLYGLYRARDHFSLFMITVIFAVYAIGVIAALLLAGHLS